MAGHNLEWEKKSIISDLVTEASHQTLFNLQKSQEDTQNGKIFHG